MKRTWLHDEGVSEFGKHNKHDILEIGCSQGIDMTEFLNTGATNYTDLI
ncbi:MAG: hypothetical protein U0T83_04180 [Bacteriovoracaceae bacterium]